MHQLILPPRTGFEIDHINRSGLDNRRSNLRYCTHSENMLNSLPSLRSAHPGVVFSKSHGRWIARTRKVSGIRKNIGYFRTKEEAVAARAAYAGGL